MAEEEETIVDEESFEELAKRAESAEDDSDEEESVAIGDDDKGERLTEKVQPIQANEFTCMNCFLVKHRSQLADKRKMYCTDCA